MVFCLRSFLFAVILLQFCALSAEIHWLGYEQTCQDCVAWSDTASGEEDSKESENDEMPGHVVVILVGEPVRCPIADREFLRFDDHVRELILPPPLA